MDNQETVKLTPEQALHQAALYAFNAAFLLKGLEPIAAGKLLDIAEGLINKLDNQINQVAPTELNELKGLIKGSKNV